MKRTIVAGTMALMCVAGAAGAQGQASPSPADVVAARQAAFALSAVTLGAIKVELDEGNAWDRLAITSGALNKWAVALPGTFPAGTGPDAVPGTKASPAIWTSRADFEAKAAAYVAATADLQAKVAANDASGALEAFGAVRGTCGSCHQAYRQQ